MPKAAFDYNGIVTHFDKDEGGPNKWVAWRWQPTLVGSGPTEACAVEDLLVAEVE